MGTIRRHFGSKAQRDRPAPGRLPPLHELLVGSPAACSGVGVRGLDSSRGLGVEVAVLTAAHLPGSRLPESLLRAGNPN